MINLVLPCYLDLSYIPLSFNALLQYNCHRLTVLSALSAEFISIVDKITEQPVFRPLVISLLSFTCIQVKKSEFSFYLLQCSYKQVLIPASENYSPVVNQINAHVANFYAVWIATTTTDQARTIFPPQYTVITAVQYPYTSRNK